MSTAPLPVPPARRRRRRVWPWVLLGVFVLLAAAAVAVDVLARSFAEKTIAHELASALKVPAETPVEVRIGGASVLLQALTGGLEHLEADVDSLTLGPLTGDLHIVAHGVPLDPSAATRELQVRYVIPESALSALTPEITGVTIDDVVLEGEELVARGGFSVFGMSLELGLGLTPSAVAGNLAFEPTTIRIGNDTYTAEQLRAAPLFGGLASALLQERQVCIADSLPAALTLTEVRVEGSTLVATLDGAGATLGGAGFQQSGSCAVASG
jgi:hypothetical protein